MLTDKNYKAFCLKHNIDLNIFMFLREYYPKKYCPTFITKDDLNNYGKIFILDDKKYIFNNKVDSLNFEKTNLF